MTKVMGAPALHRNECLTRQTYSLRSWSYAVSRQQFGVIQETEGRKPSVLVPGLNVTRCVYFSISERHAQDKFKFVHG